MKTRLTLTFLTTLVAAVPAFGHLCNNIYRTPDRVIVKPEKPVVSLERSEELRVFVQNNYPAYLHNVRLSARADGDDVTVTVTPESVPQMKAGERTAFRVKLEVKPGTPMKKLALKFGFSADEINFRAVEEPTNEQLRALLPERPNFGDNVLAAESLVRRKDPEGAKWLIGFMTNPRVPRDFRSRAIRALGKAGNEEHVAVIEKLLDEQDGFLRGNALLALGCLKAKAGIFDKFAQDRDEFVQVCAKAGAVLAGNKDALPEVRKGLSSENAFIRIACGWALAAHREKDGADALDKDFATKNAIQQVMAGDALTHIAGLAEESGP